MSRLKRFVHGAASGSALLLVNSLFSLASIPLALRFLTREQFGLWALGVQVTSFLLFVDLGMSSSMTRLLIDHKDDRASGNYGGMIRSGFLVFAAQALLILALGLGVSLISPKLFRISAPLQTDFVRLMIGLTAVTAASFVTRIFGQLLQAHQRMDLYNYAQIAGFVLSFVVLWIGFLLGAGIFSLLAANAAAWLLSSIGCLIASRALGFWPKAGEWGEASWARFREMFIYGTDLFWIALGTQLITSSQTILASRMLGVEAAAVWSIMTKPFALVCQLVWRLISISMPAFAEMQVRGETARLWNRYKLMFTAMTALSGFSAVVFAYCNGPFVTLWTGGKMHWSPLNDWLLGLWLILLTQVCSHNSLLITMKRLDLLKFAYFGEAAAFILSSLIVLSRGGFQAMLICSILSTSCFTLVYGTRHITRTLGTSVVRLLSESSPPLLRMLLLMVPLALVLQWTLASATAAVRLTVGLIVLAGAGLILLSRICLPDELALKLQDILPRALRPLFLRLLSVRSKVADQPEVASSKQRG